MADNADSLATRMGSIDNIFLSLWEARSGLAASQMAATPLRGVTSPDLRVHLQRLNEEHWRLQAYLFLTYQEVNRLRWDYLLRLRGLFACYTADSSLKTLDEYVNLYRTRYKERTLMFSNDLKDNAEKNFQSRK